MRKTSLLQLDWYRNLFLYFLLCCIYGAGFLPTSVGVVYAQNKLSSAKSDVFAPYDIRGSIPKDKILAPQVVQPLWVDYRGRLEKQLDEALAVKNAPNEFYDLNIVGVGSIDFGTQRSIFWQYLENIKNYDKISALRGTRSARLLSELEVFGRIEANSCSLFNKLYSTTQSALQTAWDTQPKFRTSLRSNDGQHSKLFREFAFRADEDYLDGLNDIYGDPLVACLDRYIILGEFRAYAELQLGIDLQNTLFTEFGVPITSLFSPSSSGVLEIVFTESNFADSIVRFRGRIELLSVYWEFKEKFGIYNRWDEVLIALISEDKNTSRKDRIDLVSAAIERTLQTSDLYYGVQQAANRAATMVQNSFSGRRVGDEGSASSGPYSIIEDVPLGCDAFKSSSQVISDQLLTLLDTCKKLASRTYKGALPPYATFGFVPTRASILNESVKLANEIGIQDPKTVDQIACLIILGSAETLDKSLKPAFPKEIFYQLVMPQVAENTLLAYQRLHSPPIAFRCSIDPKTMAMFWSFSGSLSPMNDIISSGLPINGIGKEFEAEFRQLDRDIDRIEILTSNNRNYSDHVQAIQKLVHSAETLSDIQEAHHQISVKFERRLMLAKEEASSLYESGVHWGQLSKNYIKPLFHGEFEALSGDRLGEAIHLGAFYENDIDVASTAYLEIESRVEIETIDDEECANFISKNLTAANANSLYLINLKSLCYGTRTLEPSDFGKVRSVIQFGVAIDLMKRVSFLECNSRYKNPLMLRVTHNPSEAERKCYIGRFMALYEASISKFLDGKLKMRLLANGERLNEGGLPNSLINLQGEEYGFE